MELNQNIELFEAYTDGSMSGDRLKKFEARLAYDSEFKASYEIYLSVEKGIKQHFRNEVKSKLEEIDGHLDSLSTVKKGRSKTLYLWSSSVAAAIVISVFLFNHFSTISNQDLALSYWKSDPGLPVKMSSKGKYDDAMNAYKLKNWEVATKELTKLKTDTAYYYLGLVSFQRHEFAAAIQQFEKIENNSHYYESAQFRLGLTFLSLNKKDDSKIYFEALSEHSGKYRKSSNEILDQINSK